MIGLRDPAFLARTLADGLVMPDRTDLALELIGDNAPSGSIATWPDTSGHGFDPFQAGGARQATRIDEELNGHAVARFGTDDVYEIPGMTGSSEMTIIAVVRSAVADTGYQRILVGYSPYGGILDLSSSDNISGATMYAGAVVARAFSTTSFQVIAAKYHGANSAIYRNGAMEGATGNPGSDVPSGFRLCALDTSGTQSLNGDLAHLLVFSTALSDSRREAWEDYLGALYALAITH